MAANNRLKKELMEVKTSAVKFFRCADVNDYNILHWEGLIIPENAPYKSAFKIVLNFPPEYPFKPPKIAFLTKIYHPNVSEEGQICLPLISPENWKPATKVLQILQALVALINNPEPDHPLRADVADMFLNDRRKFNKIAEEFTKKHGEKVPIDTL